MIYLYAFIIGGLICGLSQIIMNVFKLTVGHMTTMFVCIGTLLDFNNFYDKLIDFAGAGATVPLTGFGNLLAKGAIQIDSKDDDYSITGYAIQPSIHRATKYYMYIYMNLLPPSYCNNMMFVLLNPYI